MLRVLIWPREFSEIFPVDGLKLISSEPYCSLRCYYVGVIVSRSRDTAEDILRASLVR